MDQTQKNLRDVINRFLKEINKTVKQAKKGELSLSNQDLESLAERIWEMHHYAIELLNKSADETSWYNASIIRDMTDQPLEIDSRTTVSLVRAADEVKREQRHHSLQTVVKALAEEDMLREVLLGDLEQISRELAA